MAHRRDLTPARYRLSFLVGGLLSDEAVIAATTYHEHGDWAQTRSMLDRDNLLRARTQASAIRISRELIQRMSTLTNDEVVFLTTAPSPDRKHLMWAAFCRRYDLVAEFAEEVLRDHFLLGDMTVMAEDFERFWAGKALWHEELESVRPSTRRKLRTNLFLAMRQAGLLSEAGEIEMPLLSPPVRQFLTARSPNDIRFFPVRGGEA